MRVPKAVNFDVPQLVLLAYFGIPFRTYCRMKKIIAELEFDKKIDQALNKEIEELDAVTKALIEESGLEELDKELQKELELEDAAIKELLN